MASCKGPRTRRPRVKPAPDRGLTLARAPHSARSANTNRRKRVLFEVPFCLLAFTAMSAVPNRFWSPLWKAVTACAAAFVILLVLGFNRTQVVNARQERAFFAELQSFVTQDRLSGAKFPRHYLIQLAEPAPFLPVSQLADRYAHTILGRDVTFRVVKAFPAPLEENTLLIWKDERLSKPLSAMSDETSDLPRVHR